LEVRAYEEVQTESSKFDLTFNFTEGTEGILLDLTYNSDIYSREMAERLCGHLERLLPAVCGSPDAPISELDYLGAAERKELLESFNDTAVAYPEEETLVSLFEAQAAQAPGSPALVFGEQTLSYSELNGLSNRLAHFLRSRGVGREDLVGIMQDRSEWLVISILGVLKAGGAYVPVDPGYPSERISYMLKDSGCKVLIDDSLLSEFRSSLAEYGADNLAGVNESKDLAYVIYTSGSTGKPKGVMVEHRSVVNLVIGQRAFFRIDETDHVLQFSNISFDASVEQIFIALTAGALLSVIDKETVQDPLKLESYITNSGVTHIHMVPEMLKNIEETNYPSLRRVVSGGDKCSTALATKWNAYAFYNEYGPTETTVTSIELAWNKLSSTELSIGKPIHNTGIYILDTGLKLQPIGVTGEICIGGAGVARGYLNREELSREKFIANPFKPGERLYRTGDLGRWLADGNIEYQGRLDDQVKVRGYRIELGEIESALNGHSDVSSSVVQALDLGNGEHELVAYVVSSKMLNVPELRQYLQERLPGYMVPGHYVQLDALPLTANGKVDKKRLPSPEGRELSGGTVYEGARNETESQLIRIWEEVLGRDGIGINDNFFDLGGNSMLIIKLSKAVNKVLMKEINTATFFKYPSIGSFVNYILDIPVAKADDDFDREALIGDLEKLDF
ncbi:amino acid adenylation domain-containing protein, partial [Mucilaginibacter angelicae]